MTEHVLGIEEALADLDFLFQTVQSVHPHPLANVRCQDYVMLRWQCGARLKEAAGPAGEVPKQAFAVALAEAGAFFGDGHTSCFLSPSLLDRPDPTRKMLPFRLDHQFGRIVIGTTIEELDHLRGRRLLQVNRVDTLEFLAPILSTLSGERDAFRIGGFIHRQEVYWALVAPVSGPQIAIAVEGDRGEADLLTVDLLSIEEYERRVPPTPGRKRGDQHKFHHDGKTCYWRYDSFACSDGAKEKIDALFGELREKGAANLVLDLRFNGGGDSSAGDYILSHLTSRPYRMYSRMDARLSAAAIEQREGLREAPGELLGLVITERPEPHSGESRGALFDGRLFLLTGPDTFSSAADFAAVVKDYAIGTIIGEETGGLRECFGDVLRFQCPNSGIRFGVSFKRFYAPVPKPGDDLRGTVPDVAIDEDTLSEHAGEGDPLLAFVLDYVGRQ